MSGGGRETNEVQSGPTSNYHDIGMPAKGVSIEIIPNLVDQFPFILGGLTTTNKDRGTNEL
jgi:hypothetical protein